MNLKRVFEPRYRLSGIEAGHFKVTYRNIQALKCPFDYVIYQMIIFEVQPDIIIEIGTSKGGSALYLADLLELAGKGVVHTIDKPGNESTPLIEDHPRIRVFREGFRQYDTEQLRNFQKIMVIDDGSHLYEDCLESLKLFSPFVSPNSYFIMEDGIVNSLGRSREFHGGPCKAIHEFLESNDQFMIDRKYCDLFGRSATFNTDGYLKRTF